MSRPRKPAAKKPANKIDPKALTDAQLKTRFQEELARFDRARTTETENWDEMYEAIGEILYSDPPLFLAAGHKTARAFLAEVLPGVTEQTVRAYVRVAKYFDPEDEKHYGVSKLQFYLDYLEAHGGAPLAAAKIDLRKATVSLDRGKKGNPRKVPLHEVTYDELRAAARAAKSSGRRVKKNEPPAIAALRKQLAGVKLGAIGVRLRGGRLDLSGIPLADVEALGRVLVKAKLPE